MQTTETTTETMPLYQRGCKITAGARAGPAPPSWHVAKALVLTRRASSRILKPAAASNIQKHVRIFLQHRRDVKMHESAIKIASATKLQAAWRSCHATTMLCVQRTAAIQIQAAHRRAIAIAETRMRIHTVMPAILCIQAAARACAARRLLHAAVAAARRLQSAWRMVRSKVLGGRLARAADTLRRGGTLSKYRAGGAGRERHERRVWLSKDLQQLCWAEGGAAEEGGAVKSVSMATVTAVSAGVKTALMKKMEKRADPRRQGGLGGSLAKGLGLKGALPLDESTAFSVISRDRVLDFVAPSAAEAKRWLRDLRTILVFGHHLDHEAAVAAVAAGVRRGSLADAAEGVQVDPRHSAASAA